MAEASGHRPSDDATVAQLVNDLSRQTSQLIREEMRLAQVELQQKGKHAGIGLGLFSGAGLLAFFGAACLLTTVILALALVMPAWLSALIVTVVLFIAAGVTAMAGRKEVSQASPPKPEQTMENVPRDVQAVKEPMKERSRR